jgi:hypothetical protein
MECGDQVLRNFLNGLLFTCVEPKKIQNPNDVLAKHKAQIPAKDSKRATRI